MLKSIRSYILGALLLAGSFLGAQEIPSRVNDGVQLSQARTAKKDAFTGLNLSREQLKKIQAFNKEYRQQLKAVTEDRMLGTSRKRKQVQQLRQQQANQLKAVMTAPQYANYQQNIRELQSQGVAKNQGKQVVNNIEKNKGKDQNGLSKSDDKKTSKKTQGHPNDLKLTGDQRRELKLLTDDYNSRLQIARDDALKSASEKRALVRQIQREYQMQLGAILTVAQKAKWDEQQQRSRLIKPQKERQQNRTGLNGAVK